MATPAPKSPRSPHDLDSPYAAGDLIPVPDAIEGGDSAWALFSEISRQQEQRFADTAPASMPMRLDTQDRSWAQTQPHDAPPRLGQRKEEKPLFTLDAAMLVARRNNRVCPRPDRWQELFALLPPRKTLRGVQNPPGPIVGPVWKVTASLTKRLAFREHMEWAERQGVLESIMDFMQSMPEADWLHMGED
jgi:hypothetical protein